MQFKVDENSFEPGWFPNPDIKKPLFRDYRAMDEEITVDPNLDSTSIFHPTNQPDKLSLVFKADSISVDHKKKLFSLQGKIAQDYDQTKPEDYKVYIGQRQDTMVNVTFVMSSHIDNYFKGKKINEDIDFSVPAFYLDNYQELPVEQNMATKEMLLNITTTIQNKSVLVISQNNRYAEIFEIGKLMESMEE
ncbi:hypothetical protein [Allomuricauda sp. F6463D]|uniref:hypothetical protein n=1 Tax=Allomuricauda sp. F6463D TaxID=2926409 RepID=UPI001FF345DA|nr:hypothetical protein [Muricauda sp. F6463D]MCK0159438.1 hypothetical protein [Muricauda sp. F6463D]